MLKKISGASETHGMITKDVAFTLSSLQSQSGRKKRVEPTMYLKK